MIRFALVAVAVTVLTRPAVADEKSELKKMLGTWKPTTIEISGQKQPDEMAKSITLVIADANYIVTVSGQTDKGTLKLDDKAKPKAMDIVGTDGPNQGKSFPAIYETSGDTLRICYALDGKDRPSEFSTKPGKLTLLVTYQREKK